MFTNRGQAPKEGLMYSLYIALELCSMVLMHFHYVRGKEAETAVNSAALCLGTAATSLQTPPRHGKVLVGGVAASLSISANKNAVSFAREGCPCDAGPSSSPSTSRSRRGCFAALSHGRREQQRLHAFASLS